MSNGDPLLIGVDQPPDNRATSATVLVHNGSAFGTQTTAVWVQRLGTPIASAAIRGDNFSTGPKNGQVVAGVMGVIPAAGGNIGVLGAATGQPNVLFDEIGVMGVTNTFGVVGKGLSGMVEENGVVLDSSVGVLGQCDDGIGVQGVATTGFGIIGRSSARAGVTGTSDSDAGVSGASKNGVGVVGASDTTIGVWGLSDSGFAGIRASSSRGYGVFAESIQGVAILGMGPTNAIQGESNGPAGSSIGVSGLSDKGAGVQGDSNNIGVAGRSTQGPGGWFIGQVGVIGDSNSGIGVAGRSAQGTAGLFLGKVVVLGSLTVTGAKSAVVKHTDGSHRALFCLESAESMLQDFGEVTLRGASVVVKFARDFAPLIKRRDYQVFLTTYGPEAVYVRKRTSDGFEVARVNDTADANVRSIRIGYSIVARRADLRTARLPKVQLPAAPRKFTAPKVQRISQMPAAIKKQRVRTEPLPPTPKIATPDFSRAARTAQRHRTATKRKPR